jgi:hypothetical protein
MVSVDGAAGDAPGANTPAAEEVAAAGAEPGGEETLALGVSGEAATVEGAGGEAAGGVVTGEAPSAGAAEPLGLLTPPVPQALPLGALRLWVEAT